VLFGYPVEATQNNWLHECLCETVRGIHKAVDAGMGYPPWPEVLPNAHRAKLRARTGLRDRLKAYDLAVRQLVKADRDVVLEAVEAENRISELVSGTHDCATSEGLPPVVRQPAEALFGFAFELLADLDVRDPQYAAIYAAVPEHVCPFCGTEYFDAPGAAREALDHYLTRNRYPFAAANLRNLVPMGHKCNSNYKHASDLLWRSDGSRRVAFDPYNHTQVGVSLDDSEPFHGATECTPNWAIRFDPETPEVATWDEVFAVRERYRRDNLDPSYANWLGLFGKWARRAGLPTDSNISLLAALRRYEEFWTDSGMQERAFLKAAVFRMLRRHCEAGHQRLLAQIRDLVAPLAFPAPALAEMMPPSENIA
jgi:hypothetical protein